MSLGVSGHRDTQQEGGAGPGAIFLLSLWIFRPLNYGTQVSILQGHHRCLAINIACTLRERLQTTFIRKAGASKWRC
jgi:hypothetical protein